MKKIIDDTEGICVHFSFFFDIDFSSCILAGYIAMRGENVDRSLVDEEEKSLCRIIKFAL